MPLLTEEAFRELLDEHGILRPGALAQPERSRCYAIFAQRPDEVRSVLGAVRDPVRCMAVTTLYTLGWTPAPRQHWLVRRYHVRTSLMLLAPITFSIHRSRVPTSKHT